MKIYIISAALPPQLDGIGDYTANLAAELACSANVTVLTGALTPDPIAGVRMETAFSAHDPRSVWDLLDRVAQDPPDWLLLQYQPFSYGRWGRNLHLPRVMRRIKRRCPKTRFALMVHEPFVPVTRWQFAVMTTWQRWQLWSLGQTADAVFFSIEPWAQKFAAWFPGKPVVHLPVGSNIPLVPITRAEARARLGIKDNSVVFGLFGTAHVSRLLEPIRSAAEAAKQVGWEVQVLYMGPQGETIREALSGIPIISDGPSPPAEVSMRFPAIDIYFTAYSDGVSTRRGALMAGLQHSAAIVGTWGALTDGILKEHDGQAFLLADVDAPGGLDAHVLRLLGDPGLREQLGRGARELYETEFAWEPITKRLLKTLTSLNSPVEGVLAT